MMSRAAFSACVLLLGCAHGTTTNASDAARYASTDEVVVAPESGVGPRLTGGRIAMPRYPGDARARRIEGSPVVAYVVDTTGRIEGRTLTFLTSQPRELRRAICDWIPEDRFDPLVVNGEARRALVVTSFSFLFERNPDASAKPNARRQGVCRSLP